MLSSMKRTANGYRRMSCRSSGMLLSCQMGNLGFMSMSSELNIPAMRIGPGKHLKGRTLMGGIVTPDEFDHFHEVDPLP